MSDAVVVQFLSTHYLTTPLCWKKENIIILPDDVILNIHLLANYFANPKASMCTYYGRKSMVVLF